MFKHAHRFALRKRGFKPLSIGLRADAAFADWSAGNGVECIHGFRVVLSEVEALAADEAAKSDAFRLRKLIGVCFLWMLCRYDKTWDKIAYEPPPGVCSKLDVEKELYGLRDSPPDALWWMLTQLDYYLDANTGLEQQVTERLENSPFPSVAPYFANQRIQRSLRSGAVARLPEQVIQYVDACSKVRSRVSNLPYATDPVPEIDLEAALLSHNSPYGLCLFAVALLRIAGSEELLRSIFSAWNEYCATDSRFKNLITWMNSTQQLLLLDVSTSEQVLFDGATDLLSEKIPAAINLLRADNISAVQLFSTQAAIVKILNQVPWFYDVGSATAELFANGWRRKLGFRGQFSMPNLNIPELRRVCDLSDSQGLAKVSEIVKVASQAVNMPLVVSQQQLLNKLAGRRVRLWQSG